MAQYQEDGRYDIHSRVGDSIRKSLTIDIDSVPLDLTGMSAKLQVRRTKTSSDTEVDLTVGQGITIFPAEGRIDFFIGSSQTRSMGPGEFLYDLQLDMGPDDSDTILFGSVYLKEEITR